MQLFKFTLISTIAILALACTDTANTNQTANVNTTSSPVAAPANTATAPTTDEFASARATYNATCVRCHQQNGEGGDVEMDAGAKLHVPSFKKGHGLKHTDSEFARQIANGGDGMPAFKERLTPEQIGQLVRFIRHEFQAGLIEESASPESDAKH
ncbi:MAG TPA: cytochrome c [Pyrinomonadaceae bacterium]|jgi:cytochrome c551